MKEINKKQINPDIVEYYRSLVRLLPEVNYNMLDHLQVLSKIGVSLKIDWILIIIIKYIVNIIYYYNFNCYK